MKLQQDQNKLHRVMAAALLATIATFGLVGEAHSNNDEGSWVSMIYSGVDGKDRLAIFELLDDGQFILVEFRRDADALVTAINQSSMSESFDNVNELDDGWHVEATTQGLLAESESITVQHDGQCDGLVVSKGQLELHMVRFAEVEFINQQDLGNWPATPIGAAQQGQWVSGQGAELIGARHIVELVINDNEEFQMTMFTALMDGAGSPVGLLMIAQHAGTVAANDGKLNGEVIKLLSPEFVMETIVEDSYEILTHYNNTCKTLAIIGPDVGDGYDLSHFSKNDD